MCFKRKSHSRIFRRKTVAARAQRKNRSKKRYPALFFLNTLSEMSLSNCYGVFFVCLSCAFLTCCSCFLVICFLLFSLSFLPPLSPIVCSFPVVNYLLDVWRLRRVVQLPLCVPSLSQKPTVKIDCVYAIRYKQLQSITNSMVKYSLISGLFVVSQPLYIQILRFVFTDL